MLIDEKSNVSAKTSISNDTENPFHEVSFDTETEHIFINENREVFVNGKNITTITPINSEDYPSLMNAAASNQWTYSGQNEYKYDLSGVSIAGAAKVCARLGLYVSVSVLKSIGANAMFSTGVYIKDVRTIYYKNINQGRPDMKEVHSVYFVVEASNIGKYQKYLGGFTTYGGI